MTKLIIFVCFLSLMMAVPYFSVYGDSFSCAGGIVSIGDRSFDVLTKCGQPDFRD